MAARRFNHLFVPVAVAVAYAAVIVFFRGEPSVLHDRGVFLSVGARMLEGDRLYVDVIDNKDPLFFYTYAAALGVGDWRTPFLLDIAWLAVAAVSAGLLMRTVGTSRLATVVAFFAYPALLTWSWYLAGYSMLAALACAPLVAWLWLRGRFAAAGALIGVALLFKINLALIVASAPIALLVLGVSAVSARTQLIRAGAGLAGVVAMGAAILAIRGELGGYFDVIANNFEYSRDVLAETGRRSGILGHLEVATVNHDGEPWQAVRLLEATLLIGALVAVARLWGRRAHLRALRERSAVDVLAALFLAATVATVVTLALTAVWDHQTQMLAYPALLLTALVVALVQESAGTMTKRVAGCAAVALAVALAWDAANKVDFNPSGAWGESGQSQTADVLEEAADDEAAELDEVTFAHLGSNDEEAVAVFLDGRFVLACPDIAQYEFSADTPVLDCVRDERPTLVLVTPSFRPKDGYDDWNRVVAEGSSLLRARYERTVREETSQGPIDVWVSRASFGAGARSSAG